MDYNLYQKVESILREDENILNFSMSRNLKSAYFILTKKEDQFITFRVSDHAANSFFSNRTFDSKKEVEILVDEIRNYMNKANWYYFNYEDYFTLKAISKVPFKRIQFCIDNSMGIFDYNICGLIFYQSRLFGRHSKEFNIVSESLQKELRKLFASGLISHYRKGKDEIFIYINRSGRIMMDFMENRYKEKFKEDVKNIDYKYIEIPKDSK